MVQHDICSISPLSHPATKQNHRKRITATKVHTLASERTICRIRWKLLPWKLNACSNRTLSSTVHSSGNGVKFGRSARAFSKLCLCQKSMPSACAKSAIFTIWLSLAKAWLPTA